MLASDKGISASEPLRNILELLCCWYRPHEQHRPRLGIDLVEAIDASWLVSLGVWAFWSLGSSFAKFLVCDNIDSLLLEAVGKIPCTCPVAATET